MSDMKTLGHGFASLQALHLATVIDNQDPDYRGRIKVRLVVGGLELWAAVLTNSAGQDYGVSLLPKLDEKVVLAFISPEVAVVMGSLWSGGDSHPQQAREVEDIYCIRTPSGSQLKFDDSSDSVIDIKTSSGYHLQITEAEGGKVLIEKGSETIEFSNAEIKINASSKVSIEAAQVKVSAGIVEVESGMSKFSGVVKCDTLISNSVVSSSYTPGAGNIW
jgi:phage baseplate assembly protein gpV